MSSRGELVLTTGGGEAAFPTSAMVPALFAAAGERASRRLIEFLTAEIRNPHTRAAYARAIGRFDGWCQARGFALEQLTPVHVAAYVEQIGREVSKPTVKQHLAALRMLGDYLVTGQVLPFNPAAAVRGPKYVIKTGKTPVLCTRPANHVLDGWFTFGGGFVTPRVCSCPSCLLRPTCHPSRWSFVPVVIRPSPVGGGSSGWAGSPPRRSP